MSHTPIPGIHRHTLGNSPDSTAHCRPDSPTRLHLRGWVLPDGEYRDLWIFDGMISEEPLRNAVTVATDVWILPGLVDAHCHIGLPGEGQSAPLSVHDIETQAITDRDAGTLLVRDCGTPVDTRWIDQRDDLPRIVRAGRHIAKPKRYLRDVAQEVDDVDLVAAIEQQAALGDGWIKLVGDWIDRSTGDLSPLWDPGAVQFAIAHAHSLGCRVTAHCFGEDSVAELVAAGIDGIEHGTGMSPDVIDAMAQRQVALVPTLINIENFEGIARAGQEKYPHYAAHMRSLYAKSHDVFRAAVEAGVPMFAGTDAGGSVPHGQIGQEVVALGRLGDADFALGAASWRAREWLGIPGLLPGASADLVAYTEDPRQHLTMVGHPALVILRGKIVR